MVAGSEVGLGLHFGFREGGPGCSGEVVLRVVVGVRDVHSLATITTGLGFSGGVFLGNKREVESKQLNVISKD